MVSENLDVRFKNPDEPLRIFSVCAMWLTGFDAPDTPAIYLDKPMRNHTLMQTIARPNRVFQGRLAGDFEALAALLAAGKKATAVARLKASLEVRLARMIRENPSRMEYGEILQEMIDRYNAGSKNIEELYEGLKKLSLSLTEEEQRAVREGLSEEELAVFDLLTKPDPTLTKAEEVRVKKVVRELLAKLKTELLVLDWKQRQTTLAAVKVAIEETFDAGLPDVYDRALFSRKSAAVFEHIFSAHQGAGQYIYGATA